MTAHPFAQVRGADLSQEVRVLTKRFGSLLGPEFDIAIGDKAYRVGALTLKLLRSGTPLAELDLTGIDPDAEEFD